MGTFCDIVNLSSGTTVDLYGATGTITLKKTAMNVIGLVNVGADPTYTTAEGASSLVRLNSKDLGLVNEVFVSGPHTTSGPGTNSSGQAMIPEIIPLDLSCSGNEIVTIDISTTTTITTARLHTVALMYTDGNKPAKDWIEKFPSILGVRGGDYRGSSQLTTTRTQIGTTGIAIPSWVKEIVGIKCAVVKTGAITAGEEDLGYVELTSTIPDLTPQNFPTNALGATLGTPVGTGLYHDQIPWYPIHIKGTGKQETITPFINLRTTITTANRCWVSLAWR